ncbi:hypothetical protein EW146_g8576 [Bondarzewia mesenterica]|uniref:HNH nuclease domain-containing protein n=1 Tax=Bondarzewia mesenterica TaxID=1095465 RepID=A0A4S4LDB5_9AGAM|nr:hypothetical protein EW146_g8576 [Bondarzewia mesenterica]
MAEQNAETCLITGEKAGIRPYHLLPWRHWTNHPRLSRLEWSWGLKYDTIELDGSQNTVFLRLDLWELFASGKLVLMPSLDIIEKLWTRWEKLDLQSEFIPPIDEIYDGKDRFEYRLLPLVADIPAITCPSDDSGKIAAAVYSYPFENMPVVISCVKPHFVVQAAGEILDQMAWFGKRAVGLAVSRIYGTSLMSAMDAMDTIRQSYVSWGGQSPPNQFACHARITCPCIFDGIPDEPLRSPSPQPAPGPINRISRSRSPAPYPHVSRHRGKRCHDKIPPNLPLFRYTIDPSRSNPPRLRSNDPGLEGSREQPVLSDFPVFGTLLTINSYEEEAPPDVDRWVDVCAQNAKSYGWESTVVNDKDVRDYN